MGIINVGKCPKCDNLVTSAEVEHLDITESFMSKWHGVSLVCPHCHCILGASVDPVALKADTVEEVVAQLLARLGRGG